MSGTSSYSPIIKSELSVTKLESLAPEGGISDLPLAEIDVFESVNVLKEDRTIQFELNRHGKTPANTVVHSLQTASDTQLSYPCLSTPAQMLPQYLPIKDQSLGEVISQKRKYACLDDDSGNFSHTRLRTNDDYAHSISRTDNLHCIQDENSEDMKTASASHSQSFLAQEHSTKLHTANSQGEENTGLSVCARAGRKAENAPSQIQAFANYSTSVFPDSPAGMGELPGSHHFIRQKPSLSVSQEALYYSAALSPQSLGSHYSMGPINENRAGDSNACRDLYQIGREIEQSNTSMVAPTTDHNTNRAFCEQLQINNGSCPSTIPVVEQMLEFHPWSPTQGPAISSLTHQFPSRNPASKPEIGRRSLPLRKSPLRPNLNLGASGRLAVANEGRFVPTCRNPPAHPACPAKLHFNVSPVSSHIQQYGGHSGHYYSHRRKSMRPTMCFPNTHIMSSPLKAPNLYVPQSPNLVFRC